MFNTTLGFGKKTAAYTVTTIGVIIVVASPILALSAPIWIPFISTTIAVLITSIGSIIGTIIATAGFIRIIEIKISEPPDTTELMKKYQALQAQNDDLASKCARAMTDKSNAEGTIKNLEYDNQIKDKQINDNNSVIMKLKRELNQEKQRCIEISHIDDEFILIHNSMDFKQIDFYNKLIKFEDGGHLHRDSAKYYRGLYVKSGIRFIGTDFKKLKIREENNSLIVSGKIGEFSSVSEDTEGEFVFARIERDKYKDKVIDKNNPPSPVKIEIEQCSTQDRDLPGYIAEHKKRLTTANSGISELIKKQSEIFLKLLLHPIIIHRKLNPIIKFEDIPNGISLSDYIKKCNEEWDGQRLQLKAELKNLN